MSNFTDLGDYSPMQFTTAHFEALGRMVVSFQRLEVTITNAICMIIEPGEFLKTPAFLPKILNELSFAGRLKLLSNFLLSTDESYFVKPGTSFFNTREGLHNPRRRVS